MLLTLSIGQVQSKYFPYIATSIERLTKTCWYSNPLGESVVPSVKNQGTCGACWAFATVGTSEAAVHISEKKAPPSMSVQELIDCDVKYNMGCQGGNPIMAYNYVIKEGLVSWQEYPYMGYDDVCKRTTSLIPCAAISKYAEVNPSEKALLK